MAAGYGLTADDWQAAFIEPMLSRRKTGRYAAATAALAVPRQNGKNGALEIRELYGMVVLGERFLHTAHEVKTARKAFRRIASFFENERQFPELAALVTEIRKTNGQEAIVLANGGSVEFIARSSGSGRGFTVDVLVCDEAQDLTDDELGALLPTISAAPLGNPQVILTGTPPDPEKQHLAKGEVFRRVRSDAQAGTDPNLCFIDYGVPDGALPDVDDRDLWHRVNPALGGRLNLAEVVRERKLMSPEKFARERLGWWGDPSTKTDSAFGAGKWEACRVEDAPSLDGLSFAIARSIDQAWSSIGAVSGDDVAGWHVGPVDRYRGSDWVVARAAWLQKDYPDSRFAIDGKGPASALIPALEDAGVRLIVAGSSDLCDGSAALFDSVQERRIRHRAYPELDAAVADAKRRSVVDRWAWGRRNSDISMLEAVTLALWGATQPEESELVPFVDFL